MLLEVISVFEALMSLTRIYLAEGWNSGLGRSGGYTRVFCRRKQQNGWEHPVCGSLVDRRVVASVDGVVSCYSWLEELSYLLFFQEDSVELVVNRSGMLLVTHRVAARGLYAA